MSAPQHSTTRVRIDSYLLRRRRFLRLSSVAHGQTPVGEIDAATAPVSAQWQQELGRMAGTEREGGLRSGRVAIAGRP